MKAGLALPARDLYVSPWFRGARHFAEQEGNRWWILSAKHGLVAPDRVIEPYEQTLHRMRIAARRQWSAQVVSQLSTQVPVSSELVVLAGARYREFLQPSLEQLGYPLRVPMHGLQIGEQLAWLKRYRSGRG